VVVSSNNISDAALVAHYYLNANAWEHIRNVGEPLRPANISALGIAQHLHCGSMSVPPSKVMQCLDGAAD
jgi:hypothetical protein